MSKVEHDDELRPEYRREDFPDGLVRGKHAAAMVQGSNIVRLDPDVAKAFPTSEAVNDALRALLKIAARTAADAQS
ncbi:MAG: hypothetical protein GVY09_08025 [Gammaproteobacteria bacterium]|jgi:hypothetical protein|nr:hypothetical protein [Gammaproteobacteria bacterium]